MIFLKFVQKNPLALKGIRSHSPPGGDMLPDFIPPPGWGGGIKRKVNKRERNIYTYITNRLICPPPGAKGTGTPATISASCVDFFWRWLTKPDDQFTQSQNDQPTLQVLNQLHKPGPWQVFANCFGPKSTNGIHGDSVWSMLTMSNCDQ